MAKPIAFNFGGQPVAFGMTRVTREKLYGAKRVEILDENQQPCEAATLGDDGHTLLARGGKAIGYVTSDLLWTDKSQLQPVDGQGNELTPVASSFNAPIELGERAEVDEYFNHNAKAVYELDLLEGDGKLAEELKAGAIFKFEFSYRGGLDPDTAFLLANAAGNVFMVTADETAIEYAGLQQAAAVVDDQDEEEAGIDDMMDFDMI